MIQFYSTTGKSPKVSLEEAVMQGLASDGGLFMPDSIPVMTPHFFNRINSLSFQEVGFEVANTLLQGIIPPENLLKIVDNSMTFEVPLKALEKDLYALELFHGPTMSFKDFGARFMAQLLGYFVQHRDKTLNILVATSGDTGSAIADGFYKVPGIHVWILYPKGKVTWSQEKQMTTMGHNITALEVEGTFDDCQRLVKAAFSDKDLRQKISLTSANSINIARLIPQSFYYFYAYAQLKNRNLPLVFSVPSGNFGNLTAGLLSKKMGLPVTRFIAATNANDTVPRYLQTGVFEPLPSKQTLSNAMDVGNPSNFARMLDIYKLQLESMRQDIVGISFTDAQTRAIMQDVFSEYGYLMDPHGAVACLGLIAYFSHYHEKANGIFLETADPAKFADDVEKITKQKVPIPERLKQVLSKEKQTIVISSRYEEFKELLLDKNT